MSYWQFRNMYAVGERGRDFLAKKGMDIADLPPKLREIIPILESAKNEDDPTLQEMWASLLAASLDPNNPESTIQYHELLRMVSPFDAKLLNLLGPANSTVFKRLTPDDNHELQVRVLAEFLKAEDTTVTLSLQQRYSQLA